MQVSDKKAVFIRYTLADATGTVIDSSSEGDPLGYLHGMGNLIPGLEKALAGKSSGDKIHIDIPPEEAYGPRLDTLVQSVPRSAFQDIEDIQPGMQFHAESSEGPNFITVTEVEDDHVTIDGNHPLAGKTLTFDVEVTGVRDPTEEELNHGHIHGPGGDHPD